MNPWERYVVPNLIACACGTKPIMKQREKVVPKAEGRVLELGCGAGTLGFGNNIEFLETGAEAIPLEDNSVDTAVITFVLCTIPDWRAALAETRRVLKPEGRILFSEHGLAPDEEVAKWQRRIEPVWKPLAGGCHLTRDVAALFTESGFRLEEAETMYLPSTPKVAGFVSWGAASAA